MVQGDPPHQQVVNSTPTGFLQLSSAPAPWPDSCLWNSAKLLYLDRVVEVLGVLGAREAGVRRAGAGRLDWGRVDDRPEGVLPVGAGDDETAVSASTFTSSADGEGALSLLGPVFDSALPLVISLDVPRWCSLRVGLLTLLARRCWN